MSDEIKGIAVLDDRNPGAEVLFVCYVPADRSKNSPGIQRIDVRPKGTAKTRETEWEYVERDGRLHLTPSLHIFYTNTEKNQQVTIFHNGYEWSTGFVRWSTVQKPDSPDDLGRSGRWTYCRQLNAAILSG